LVAGALAPALAFQAVNQPAHRLPRAARMRAAPMGPSMQLVDPLVTDMLLGAGAGTFSNMAVFPFELAKTKMQNAQMEGRKEEYCTLVASVGTITREGGVGALWAGSVPVLLGGAPESAMQLAAHSWMVSMMIVLVGAPGTSEADLPLVCQLLAGSFAGVATLGATNPMEVLRLKAARGDTRKLVTQVRELGLLGLFQGYEATLLRDLPFSTIYFPLYCWLKTEAASLLEAIQVANPATASLLVAGFGAGAVASYLTTPFDTIKTRVQSQQRPERLVARSDKLADKATPARLVTAFATKTEAPPTGVDGIRTVAKEIIANEGVGSLMTGAGVRVAKLGPNMAITLALYETAQRFISSP